MRFVQVRDGNEHTDELKQHLDAMEQRLNTRLDQSTELLQEQMRNMQTELLKAFGPWQENIQIRV